ncbi:MAG: hypothetical protein QOH46_1497 [Solirubrobacteraceae bacterium]|nr:hypothetical protein [Solirubrobacteraceae bacterium]
MRALESSDPGAPLTEATLRRLAGELGAKGGLLAAALDGAPPAAAIGTGEAHLGELAASGPRAAGRREDVALVVEAIREGFLVHYRESRLLRDDDADLLLLAGDHLYAIGLARLAAAGDLDAVGELADVISLCAQAHAEGRPELADAAWHAGAAAVGWGADAPLKAAQDAARAGAPGAEEALRAAARRLAGEVPAERPEAGHRGSRPRRLPGR